MDPDTRESSATATLEEEVSTTAAETQADAPQFEPEAAIPDPNPSPPASSILIRKTAPTTKPAEPSLAEPPAPPPVVRRPFVLRMAELLLWPIVAILAIMDTPFAGLSAGLKSILGIVALATSVVAAATWGAALFIPQH